MYVTFIASDQTSRVVKLTMADVQMYVSRTTGRRRTAAAVLTTRSWWMVTVQVWRLSLNLLPTRSEESIGGWEYFCCNTYLL